VQLSQFQRSLCALTVGALFVCAGPGVSSQEQPHPDGAHPPEPQKQQPIPQERSSVTHHEITVNGQTLHYTATAGTLLIRDGEDDHPYGSIFSVAYTLDGADPNTRPVTFLYNGGPGSSSIWLHMGSVGPVRVVTDSPEATGPAPYQVVPNQYTLLDRTDLVFIDAPLTGFSRAVGKGTPKDFNGVDQDLKAFDKFILRWVTVNERWNSPKYLFGESYGTTRSAGLSDALENSGISLNGVILLSSILNYNILVPGIDEEYIGCLPSYAAIAWYHNKLANKPPDLKQYIEQVREFARGPYAEALAQGDMLPPDQFDAVAQKVAAYTGLSVQYVKDAKLRINPSEFRKQLLRDQGEILGRYDARFEGTDANNVAEFPGYDPSDSGIAGAFTSAFYDYLTRQLKYESDEPYRVSSESIGQWDWHHRAPGMMFGFQRQQRMPDVALDLADAMRKNPKMKVFSANGMFDLATPFFLTEFDINHMMLAPQLTKNVEFGYYPAGHMVYLNVEALKELVHDLDGFYAQTDH
jgi:carboxypeptidase C (cathepsin A)